MNKFKVGDRVAVYRADERYTGFIEQVISDQKMLFRPGLRGENHQQFYVHPKQCRKLTTKITLKGKKNGHVIYLAGSDETDGYSFKRHSKKDIKMIEAEDQS